MSDLQMPAGLAGDGGDFGAAAGSALSVVRSGRWTILLTGLGSVLLAVAVLSLLPDVYRSEATILVTEQQIPQNLVAPLSTATGTLRLQAMTQEVLSRSSLLRIIEETRPFAGQRLSPDLAVERFRRSLEVTPSEAGRDGSFHTFTIAFSAATPEMAQSVTQRLAALFIERHSETRAQRAQSAAAFLKDRLEEKRRQAAEMERQIGEFRIRHAGSLPDPLAGADTGMAELRGQWQTVRSSLSRADQQRVIWESMLSGNLNSRLTRLRAERDGMLLRLTPKHPGVTSLSEEIGWLEKAASSLQTGGRLPADLVTRLVAADAAVGQLHGQIEANRLEVESLKQEQKRVEANLAALQSRRNAAPVLEQRLAAMVRESEGLNQELAKLESMDRQSSMAAEMERDRQGEQFRQLDAPVLPLRPVGPARFKLTAGAAAGGLALGFLAAFLLDLRKGCFHSEREIRRRFAAPLVLTVPELRTPGERAARRRTAVLEWSAGLLAVCAMLSAVTYVYIHS